jgi:hypothetical protein
MLSAEPSGQTRSIAASMITQSKLRYLLTTHDADVAANVDIGTGDLPRTQPLHRSVQFSAALDLIDDYVKGHKPRYLGLCWLDQLRDAVRIGGFSHLAANVSGDSAP